MRLRDAINGLLMNSPREMDDLDKQAFAGLIGDGYIAEYDGHTVVLDVAGDSIKVELYWEAGDEGPIGSWRLEAR